MKFKLLEDFDRLQDGKFTKDYREPKGQETREQRQRRAQIKRNKQIDSSLAAITCEHSMQNIRKKWSLL